MRRLSLSPLAFALVLALALALALAGCGSGSGGGQASRPATTATRPPTVTDALISCLQKAGMSVAPSGSELRASGNGDTVRIHGFTSPRDADAFAKKQKADSTQAGNLVGVYGPNPKNKTVSAIENCLPQG